MINIGNNTRNVPINILTIQEYIPTSTVNTFTNNNNSFGN